jgi:hypothetical protein
VTGTNEPGQKGSNTKIPKKAFSKYLYENLVFEFLSDFFQKINLEVHNQSKNTILA